MMVHSLTILREFLFFQCLIIPVDKKLYSFNRKRWSGIAVPYFAFSFRRWSWSIWNILLHICRNLQFLAREQFSHHDYQGENVAILYLLIFYGVKFHAEDTRECASMRTDNYMKISYYNKALILHIFLTYINQLTGLNFILLGWKSKSYANRICT